MKQIIIGITLLSSISAFAVDNCTYAISGNVTNSEMKMAERILSDKGFEKAQNRSDVAIVFNLNSNWVGQVQDTINIFGDTTASASLIRYSDKKILATAGRDGSLGVFAGIGNDAKAKLLLKQSIKSLPSCEDLNLNH